MGNSTVRNGSADDGHALEPTAGKLTSKLSGQTADVDGRQCPGINGRSTRPSEYQIRSVSCRSRDQSPFAGENQNQPVANVGSAVAQPMRRSRGGGAPGAGLADLQREGQPHGPAPPAGSTSCLLPPSRHLLVEMVASCFV